MQSKQVTRGEVLRIRGLILDDGAALDAWPRLVDEMIKSAADRRRVKGIFRNYFYGDAIIITLELWQSYGKSVDDLVKILWKHQLNALADKLANALPDPNSENGANSSTWFQVGEVVHNFVGRATELEKIHMMLTYSHSQESVTSNIFCIGPSGIGKSALARKYAFRYADFYGGNVIWIDGRSTGSIRASFRSLATFLQITIEDPDELCAKVYNEFTQRPSLFIVDHLSRWSDLDQFKPNIVNRQHSTPYILVTCQEESLIPIPSNQFNLDVLDRRDALLFCWQYLQQHRNEDGEELVGKLRAHPLALQIAIACIVNLEHYNLECYLQQLNKKKLPQSPEYYSVLLPVTQIAFDLVRKNQLGKFAMKILTFLVFLNLYDSESELDSVHDLFPDDDDRNRTRAVVNLLERYSLLYVSHLRKITIHSSIQRAVKDCLTEEVLVGVDLLVVEACFIGKSTASDARKIIAYIHHQKITNSAAAAAGELVWEWMRGPSKDVDEMLSNYGNGQFEAVICSLRKLRTYLISYGWGGHGRGRMDALEQADNVQRIDRCIKLVKFQKQVRIRQRLSTCVLQ